MIPARPASKSRATIIITSVRQFGVFGRRSLPSTKMFKVRLSGGRRSGVGGACSAVGVAGDAVAAVSTAVVAVATVG